MVELWVLHIISLRRTFDQSLMKFFQRVQRCGADTKVLQTDKWTDGVTDGQIDGQKDGHSYERYIMRLFL